MGTKTKALFFFAFASLCLSLAFNNCAPQLKTNSDSAAFRNAEEIENDFINLYGGKLAADTCENSLLYFCHHKIFSTDLQNQSTPATFDCVNIGTASPLCPIGFIQTYNTQAAAAECKNNRCDESYNYEEYECHLNLTDSNSRKSLKITTDNLESSIQQLYHSCQRIVGRGPE